MALHDVMAFFDSGAILFVAGYEVKEAQLATHFVPSERLPAIEEALHFLGAQARSPENIRSTLQSFEVPP